MLVRSERPGVSVSEFWKDAGVARNQVDQALVVAISRQRKCRNRLGIELRVCIGFVSLQQRRRGFHIDRLGDLPDLQFQFHGVTVLTVTETSFCDNVRKSGRRHFDVVDARLHICQCVTPVRLGLVCAGLPRLLLANRHLRVRERRTDRVYNGTDNGTV